MMIAMALVASVALQCTPGRQSSSGDSARLAWALDTWSITARPALASDIGAHWTGESWVVDPTWKGQENVAASAYFAQPILESGISLGLNQCSRRLLDEIAAYYIVASGRFRPFSVLQNEQSAAISWRGDEYQGNPRTLTLPWQRPATRLVSTHQAECLLCVAQFLHPAARLIRVLATLPLGSLNSTERQFVSTYTALLVRDQILRFAYDVPAGFGLPGAPSKGAVAGWRAFMRVPASERIRYPRALLDTHLWLLAEAAEILKAQSQGSHVVSLSSTDVAGLREFVTVGLARMQQSITTGVVGLDASGHQILGASYFNGDFTNYPDDAFAGDTAGAYPTAVDTTRVDSIGWDVSHGTRIPVVLRSLYEARSATGSAFPTAIDLEQAANQLAYRVFRGDLARPLFRNFMDGTDGWYRVGYSGRGEWGYPPSTDCNIQIQNRPCLGATILPAWGFVAPWSPRLREIAIGMTALASATDSPTIAFRNRYYLSGAPFAFDSLRNAPRSLVLMRLIADFAPQATWAPVGEGSANH